MFEQPSSKRVRREDIYRSSTPSEVSEDDSLLRERQSKLDEVFASIAPLATVDVACADHDGRQEDAERSEFEFRLFSGPISTSAITAPSIGASKINIRTPTPDIQNTGFIVPHRPGSFYVARRLPAEEREQIATAAVTGEDVQRRAGEPCPGNRLPWRVVTLGNNAETRSAKRHTVIDMKGQSGKGRLGKKRRIVIRKQASRKKERREKEEAKKTLTAAAEQEKRTRRNREKKVKRKAKEKLKKLVEKDTAEPA